MHSRRVLALKLRGAGFGGAAVTAALQRLQQLGYLDDAGFARLWVRGRAARGGESRAQVLAGLVRRGVAHGAAQAALDAEYPPEREAQICRRLAARLAQRLPPAARESRGARLARQLAQRGFPGSRIVPALRELQFTGGPADEEFEEY